MNPHRTQLSVLTNRLRTGKVKNRGPVKGKIKQIKIKKAWNNFLAS